MNTEGLGTSLCGTLDSRGMSSRTRMTMIIDITEIDINIIITTTVTVGNIMTNHLFDGKISSVCGKGVETSHAHEHATLTRIFLALTWTSAVGYSSAADRLRGFCG